MRQAARLKGWGNPRYQKDGDPADSGPGFGVSLHHDKLDLPLRWRKPRRVFVNSMSDLFHPQVPTEFIQAVFETIVDTPQHSYSILTKRSGRLAALAGQLPWPPHLEIGVTIGLQRWAFRAAHLRSTGAAVKFINCEPLLGPLQLELDGIDYVRAGGETERGFRECHPDWVRSLRDQCLEAGVPFQFMHWSGLHPSSGGNQLDGEIWDQQPPARPLG
jgi:protein gp37